MIFNKDWNWEREGEWRYPREKGEDNSDVEF